MGSTFVTEQKSMLPGLLPGLKEEQKQEIEECQVIRVVIRSARGLRDTDFHPGVDKSDPYCVCEFVGKPETQTSTDIVNDCLDPVWDHLAFMGPYERGDSLLINIYDYDPGAETLGGDDSLGTLTLLVEDVLATSGPAEYKLNNAGSGATAFVTLEIDGPCIAWPSLVNTDTFEARKLLAAVHPEFTLELLDIPSDDTCPVVSWDDYHKKNGYKGSFFGAFQEDARHFKEGDSVEVFPRLRRSISSNKAKLIGTTKGRKLAAFESLSGESGPAQMISGKVVRYIHVKEGGLNVDDGMQWKRVPKKYAPGFFPNRVVLYSDPMTNTVVRLAGNG